MLSFWKRPIGAALGAMLALSALTPLAVFADQDDGDQPVARISMIRGDVAVQRGDAQSAVAAVANAPVMGADYITTGPNSAAEVQIDGRTSVRLGANVQMRFVNLEPSHRQLQLASGTILYRTFHGSGGHVTIDTPSISVIPEDEGAYRVGVNEDGRTDVTVRSGQATITTPTGNQSLTPGTTLLADGTAANPNITTEQSIALDDFDAFNRDRDSYYGGTVASAPYVDPSIDGTADLARAGRWVPAPDYGEVWVPAHVAPDWAPYREGRWAWEEGYGWTWVSADPWGWAPYHYGSWYHNPQYGWAWVPPPRVVYAPPVYRPALVAFIGFGGGGGGFAANISTPGFSLSFGNIGWVPLAPGEPWHPWYGGGGNHTIVNNVTNINVTKVYNNYNYNGATGTTYNNFVAGNFINHSTVRSEKNVTVFRGAIPVVPNTAHLAYSNRAVNPQLASLRSNFSQPSGFAGAALVSHRTAFEDQRQAVGTATHLAVPPPVRSESVVPVSVRSAPLARANPSLGAQRSATGFGRSASVSGASPAAVAGAAAANPPTKWDRFSTARGIAGPAATRTGNLGAPRGSDSAAAYGAQRAATSLGAPRATTSYGAPAVSPTHSRSARSDSWSRFGQNRGQAPSATTSGYIAPTTVRTRSQSRTATSDGGAYRAPRSYTAPQQYSAPRANTPPRQSYGEARSQSSRSYGAPAASRVQRSQTPAPRHSERQQPRSQSGPPNRGGF